MSNENYEIPIIILVYNRVDYLYKLIESIRKIKPKVLYVSSDGPKENDIDDYNKVMAVRDYLINSIDWDCNLNLNFREINEGLKKSVTSGLNWFFEQEEFGIILEDDIIPNETFFSFMKDNLIRFRDDNRIMMISGNNFLDFGVVEEDYYFSSITNIWGWATWRRSWAMLDNDMEHYNQDFINEMKKKYRKRWVVLHYIFLFDSAKYNSVDSWGIPWNFTCLYFGGLSIVPRYNLCMNIGELGTHFDGKVDKNLYLNTYEYTFSSLENEIIKSNDAYDYQYHKKMHRKGVYIRIIIETLKYLRLFFLYRFIKSRIVRRKDN